MLDQKNKNRRSLLLKDAVPSAATLPASSQPEVPATPLSPMKRPGLEYRGVTEGPMDSPSIVTAYLDNPLETVSFSSEANGMYEVRLTDHVCDSSYDRTVASVPTEGSEIEGTHDGYIYEDYDVSPLGMVFRASQGVMKDGSRLWAITGPL